MNAVLSSRGRVVALLAALWCGLVIPAALFNVLIGHWAFFDDYYRDGVGFGRVFLWVALAVSILFLVVSVVMYLREARTDEASPDLVPLKFAAGLMFASVFSVVFAASITPDALTAPVYPDGVEIISVPDVPSVTPSPRITDPADCDIPADPHDPRYLDVVTSPACSVTVVLP